MGSTNFGNQKLRFLFQQPADSISFNQLFNKILPTGLYWSSGAFTSLLTNVGNTQINIAPFIALIRDSTT